MKQFSTDTYTIAWFSLAEYVSRGEKQRTLGLFRLLSHSLGDPAYVVQLEGDILYAFRDQDAEKKYVQAAKLYSEQGKIVYAIALYEQLIALSPTNMMYRYYLITMVKNTSYALAAVHHVCVLCNEYIITKQYHKAFELICNYPLSASLVEVVEQLLIVALTDNYCHDIWYTSMYVIVDYWVENNQDSEITRFSQCIKALNHQAYQALYDYLQQR